MQETVAQDVIEQVEALAERAERADGVAPLGEQTLLDLRAHASDPPLLTRHQDGRLVAAAAWPVEDPDSVEIVVDPDSRRQGWGSGLVEELIEQRPNVRFWAHGNLAGALGTASANGLHVARELWRMELDTAEHPPQRLELPEGFTVRPFVPGQDEQAWLEVNGRAFVDHPEQGRMTMEDLREREALPWFDPAGLLLVEDVESGRLAASHWTKIEEPGRGEVYVVAVDPDFQGRGLAAPLTSLGLQHLIDAGAPVIELYVESDNDRAVATYRRMGFARVDVHAMYAR